MGAPRLRAELERVCESEAMADALLHALAPDNANYVKARVEGARLLLSVEGSSWGEVRRSLDDLLACLGTAEKVWARASPTRDGSRTSRTPTP